jgi:hypothetical protein
MSMDSVESHAMISLSLTPATSERGPILVIVLLEFARTCGFRSLCVYVYGPAPALAPLDCLFSRTPADANTGSRIATDSFIANYNEV